MKVIRNDEPFIRHIIILKHINDYATQEMPWMLRTGLGKIKYELKEQKWKQINKSRVGFSSDRDEGQQEVAKTNN